MTIEQEFFKAFGIEPYDSEDWIKDFDDGKYEYRHKLKYLRRRNAIDLKIIDNKNQSKYRWEIYCKLYPEITPKIVLGLIKIITDKGYSFKVFEAEDMFNNGIKYVANTITDIKHDIYGRGKNINEAVISLCIQLKYEIQTQVRALFNEM